MVSAITLIFLFEDLPANLCWPSTFCSRYHLTVIKPPAQHVEPGSRIEEEKARWQRQHSSPASGRKLSIHDPRRPSGRLGLNDLSALQVHLPEQRPSSRRSGLSNLRYRAECRGGRLDLREAPEGGLLVRWSVPLPR